MGKGKDIPFGLREAVSEAAKLYCDDNRDDAPDALPWFQHRDTPFGIRRVWDVCLATPR